MTCNLWAGDAEALGRRTDLLLQAGGIETEELRGERLSEWENSGLGDGHRVLAKVERREIGRCAARHLRGVHREVQHLPFPVLHHEQQVSPRRHVNLHVNQRQSPTSITISD